MSFNTRLVIAAVLLFAAPGMASAQQQPQSPANAAQARAPMQIAVEPNVARPPDQVPEQQIAEGEPCRPEFGCAGFVFAALDLHELRLDTPGHRIDDRVAGFTERAEIIMKKDRMAGEVLYDILLGGGTGGFDVRGALQFGFGTRLDLARGQGVYGRAGAKLVGMKNNHLGFGEVSLPRADIGYQYMRRDILAEVGGDVALTMISELAMGRAVPWGVHKAGEVETSDFARNRSTYRPSWGAHMVWRNDFLVLRAHFARIETGAEGPGPLDTFESILCGFPTVLAVCTDVRHWSARAVQGRPEGAREVDASAWMVGLAVGAGLLPK